MANISVIVPAFGHCPHLPDLIRALEGGTRRPDEIIVSHSGSHDPTEELAAVSRSVLVLHHPERLFAGAARNRGAGQARGEWLAFVDADVRPRPDWLERILGQAEANARRFVVGSVGCATTGGYWGMCNWLCEFSEQAPWHPARRQTGGASCNMLVRAEDFRISGGFAEDYQPAEDTMLFSRLRSAGLEQWFEPRAQVDHHNQAGFRAFVRHQVRLGYHSALVRQRTRLPGSAATRIRPLALGLWIPRLWLIARRISAGGPGRWLSGAAYAPGLLLGSWIWTAGFLRRVLTSRPDAAETGQGKPLRGEDARSPLRIRE